MTKILQLIKKSVLLGVTYFMISNGTVVLAQTEITVEPGFNTLLDAVNTNPGATLILKRGESYVIDTPLPITMPTIIKGEKEPAATSPGIISFFADPGAATGKSLIELSANFVLQDVGVLGTTYDEQQVDQIFNVLAGGINITLDGNFFQNYSKLFWSGYQDGLTIVEKNNKFFNMAVIGWDNGAGVGFEWANSNINFHTYNNTYFVGGRCFGATGCGPIGSETMEHNTYVATWGDVYFPITNDKVKIQNNLYYDSQVRGYVGARYAADGSQLWVGDYSDWTQDSVVGMVPIEPHLADSVGDQRPVIVTHNLKVNSKYLLDFQAANKVTTMPFFNTHDLMYGEKYGWNLKDNMLQENGTSVDPQFTNAIPAAAYEMMFKERIERGLPAAMQGAGFPYYLGWIPAGKTKADFQWPFPLNFKPSNLDLRFAGSDGYPIGDLNWYGPDVVAAWEKGAQNPLTGIKEAKSAEFSLKNYPNPFNSSTLISYTLPEQNKVSLMVFNSAGVKIATLVNETQKAGSHEVTFNSGNLSNGIYFYKMQVGALSQIQKMIVAK